MYDAEVKFVNNGHWNVNSHQRKSLKKLLSIILCIMASIYGP